jgi:hypothetical protein
MAGTDLRKMEEGRVTADLLLDVRGFRLESNSEWKDRQRKTDELYRGEFAARWAGEFDGSDDQLMVMNLVQTGLDDVGRLSSESLPIIKCPALGDSEKASKEANVREGIAHTYWEYNTGEILTPKLAMDLAGSGAAFVVVTWDDSPYPRFVRIDPRFCYPDVHNGRLQDLFVIRTMRVRQAARLFPNLNFPAVSADDADQCEILEYYAEDECVQGLLLTKGGSPRGEPIIVKRYNPGLGCVPVGFAQLDTFDGHFRGMFDQIGGVLRTKHRVVRQVVDYTDQMVYSPMISKGVLNHNDPPGPNTIYRLDPNVPDASFGRVEPAGQHPQLWHLLDFLDSEQRAGASYPVQRHGEVSQSIASAAFVNSTMGQLTTAVRNIQRLLGALRSDLNYVAYKVDEKYLNFQKPLMRAIGGKKTYTPEKAIDGKYYNMVTYGAGSGLDRANADVRVLQHQGAGIISKETAREQVDFITDPSEEQAKIERETTASALMQKILTEAPVDMTMKLFTLMSKGDNLAEAVEKLQAEAAAAPAQPPGSPPAAAPGQSTGPADAQAAATSLEKGGVPGQAPELQEVDFGNTPLTNIVVKPPGA